MSRYPYTDAADFIRSRVTDWQDVGGQPMRLPSISRADASQAYGAVAEALGMDKEDLAKRLADYAAKEPTR